MRIWLVILFPIICWVVEIDSAALISSIRSNISANLCRLRAFLLLVSQRMRRKWIKSTSGRNDSAKNELGDHDFLKEDKISSLRLKFLQFLSKKRNTGSSFVAQQYKLLPVLSLDELGLQINELRDSSKLY